MRKPSTVQHSTMEIVMRKAMMRSSTFVKWDICSTDWIIAAVLPKNVLPPVNSTVASTSPRVTVDPTEIDEKKHRQ